MIWYGVVGSVQTSAMILNPYSKESTLELLNMQMPKVKIWRVELRIGFYKFSW